MHRQLVAGIDRPLSVVAFRCRPRQIRTRIIAASMLVAMSALGRAQGSPAAQPAATQGSHLDASIAVHAGTLGFGLEVGKLLVSHLGVRAGFNYFSYSLNHTFSSVAYSAKLRLQNVPVLLDVYPWGRGPFHVTGGLLFNQNRFTGSGVPDSTGFTINGTHYTKAEVGVLNAAIKYPSTGGYAGLGFGTSARKSLIAPTFDFGAVFSTPQVSLTATGGTNPPQLASDLQAQQNKTQHDVRKFKVYPVISFGLMARF